MKREEIQQVKDREKKTIMREDERVKDGREKMGGREESQ